MKEDTVMSRGEGSCPYSREINAWDGRWYCTCKEKEVGSKTFNRYCYHFEDYRDCPAWKKENGY